MSDDDDHVWDNEVDVLCVGGAIGTLASAVAAADAEVEVLVATSAAQDGAWLPGDVADAETLEYFAALTAGVVAATPVPDAEVPKRVVYESPAPEQRGRKVPTFYGGRLKDWAAQCLSSPYGLLHTRVSNWGTENRQTLDDKPVQVKIIEKMNLDPAGGAPSLVGRLFDAADARGIDIRTETTLKRLIFEDGAVIGAVLADSEGSYTVRARHGVTLAPAVAIAESAVVAGAAEVQLALVSQAGSRFAQVEILVPAATPTPAATRSVQCTDSNRRMAATLRGARRGRSESRRWRKVDRYPPFGQ